MRIRLFLLKISKIFDMYTISNIKIPSLIGLFLFVINIFASQDVYGIWINDRKTYEVGHNFVLKPGGNVVPTVTAKYFEHAWVLDPGLRSNVNPLPQFPGFDNGGFELVDNRGRVFNHSRNGANNGQVNIGSFLVPAAGIPVPGLVRTAFVPPPTNTAEANSRFIVNPFGIGGPIAGKIQVDGFAEAWFETVLRVPTPSLAYAFSYAQITARGGRQLRNGQINWIPQISTPPISGNAIGSPNNRRHGRDPIVFEISDLESGKHIEEVLVDISYDIIGDGTLEWDGMTGSFSIDVQNAEFHINMSSPFTLQQGVLDLKVINGSITVANDTGIFDGLLPSVGNIGTFSTKIGDITLDYDFGEFDGHELDIVASFSGAGSAQAEIVPEPNTFLLFGSGFVALLGYGWRRGIKGNGDRQKRCIKVSGA